MQYRQNRFKLSYGWAVKLPIHAVCISPLQKIIVAEDCSHMLEIFQQSSVAVGEAKATVLAWNLLEMVPAQVATESRM